MGAITNHVTITVSRNSVGITRAGFGTMLILTPNFVGSGKTASYSDLDGVAADYTVTTSAEYLAAQAAFSQDLSPSRIKFGKLVNKPTMKRTLDSITPVLNSHAYKVNVTGDGVTTTEVSITSGSSATQEQIHDALKTALNAVTGKNYTVAFAPLVVADFTFTADNATEIFTHTAHGLVTGDGPIQVSNSGGALPSGLSALTDYWVIAIDANTFYLATSLANALAGTHLLISTNGTGTQTASDTVDTVRPSDPLVATGSASGEWFSFEVKDTDDLATKMTHVDPGAQSDLNAIKLYDPDFYAVYNLYNSNAMALEIAAWVESNKRIFLLDTNDSECITTATGNSDTVDDIKSLARDNTLAAYYHAPNLMFGAAWLGAVLPLDPGTETWADKNLSGVEASPLTQTHRDNLTGKNGNGYESVAGIGITFEGKVGSGEYLDTTRFLHWFEDNASKRIFGLKVKNKKIPMSDPGIAKIESELRAALVEAEQREGILPGWSVKVPLAADISEDDRASRTLNGVRAIAQLAGAVAKINVTINVIP